MRVGVAILAAVCVLALLPAGAHARGCPGQTLKPTLVSEIPSEIALHDAGAGSWYVIFRAGMRNEGSGPLTITGRRKQATEPMRARQVLDCAGSRRVRHKSDIGGMNFARVPTHQHFHLRDIERYRLVGLADGRSYRSYKRGFCLGDSYDPGVAIARKPAEPGFDGNLATACGQGRSDALSIREGLSVGWGDYYSPLIEGQYVDLTKLAAGQYRLLTELDPFERLVVGSRAKSIGGVDFRLSWPNGTGAMPAIEITGTCNTLRSCASRQPATNLTAAGSAALGRAQPVLGGRLAG